ncbi:MAG TPA: hypothetical protein VME43_10580 [Bryobacteraceae bacterium]|nr:hypothetical protein [Bryobacteraceae bacterium]
MSKHPNAPRKKQHEAIRPQESSKQEADQGPRPEPLVSPTPTHAHNPEDAANHTKPPRKLLSPLQRSLEIAGILFGIGYAVVTYCLWQDTRHNFALDQRAWVGVKQMTLDKDIGNAGPLEIAVGLFNTGHTPALDVAITGSGLSSDPKTVPSLLPQESPRIVVAPGSDRDVIYMNAPLTAAQADAIKSGSFPIYVHILIEYSDIFRKRHRSEFCGYYPTPKPPYFFNCPAGGFAMD